MRQPINRNNKRITLVALVVTIIILLILAGISIANLRGNSLFEKSKLAKERLENAQKDENLILRDRDTINVLPQRTLWTGNISSGKMQLKDSIYNYNFLIFKVGDRISVNIYVDKNGMIAINGGIIRSKKKFYLLYV